jgi:hypothetical protein
MLALTLKVRLTRTLGVGGRLDNDIAPEIIAWVKQTPDCLASYRDPSQSGNPNIFHPSKPQTAFVTPRSLEKASHIVKQRHHLGDEVTISLLSGTIGESAARAMQAFFTVIDKLPTWEAIINDPKGAKLPDDVVARCLTVFSAVARIKDSPTVEKFMGYVTRMEKEWQALFARSIMASSEKQKVCYSFGQVQSLGNREPLVGFLISC